jgi:hypothetical protein
MEMTLRWLRHGAALAITLVILSACSDDGGLPKQRQVARHSVDETVAIDTAGSPPVLSAKDLEARGFDTPTLREIEDELFPLNSSLTALAALKRSYDVTTNKEERGRINATSIPYHIAADRYQRDILLSLKAPLDSLFDSYVEQRKREVGLQDWHPDHRQPPSGTEVPGLVKPRQRTHERQ